MARIGLRAGRSGEKCQTLRRPSGLPRHPGDTVTDLPARTDRSSTAPSPGPRLPSRLRGRRPLVVPPAVGRR